ncbi:HNH endonuclease [Leucothrix arctica]|uniref:HNH endonuclease n=1 Tax=Leucothrix arctica TaxID=1481894 RepID=A0A317CMI9_9GAMM|nr:HNH endonuclease [Leucothrix arctica]PWQ97530.1 HNH endonuclease [Leucothrix arctica]
MANTWNIPDALEQELRARDKVCVYCRTEFTPVKESKYSCASLGKISKGADMLSSDNIAICCWGCKQSKGQKPLSVWLKSKYCQDRNISSKTVATIIKKAILKGQ